MRISDDFLRELKFRSNLAEIASRYAQLKRQGSGLVGRCPFHSEKTPSFHVNDDKGFFYCFGCGAGGDVITFVRQAENLDYIDAVTKLAEWARLPMPEEDGGNDIRPRVDRKRLLELNREAALFFHKNLYDPKDKRGIEYLRGRGITDAAIRHFGLGYAPDSWEGTLERLKGQGYTVEEIQTAYLCAMGKNGKPFDNFRGRVMFPIIDLNSNVIAFSGRRIDGESERKYINSSDTPVFNKSKNLYGLNLAKNAKSDTMIICEGNIDVVAMHHAGFANSVATLGTAITPDHARLVARYAKRALLAYDSDAAGQRASEKAASLLAQAGVEVSVLSLGEAKDPDEYIKRFGRERFANLIESSKDYISHNLDLIWNKYDNNDPAQKARALSEVCVLLIGIESHVERDVYASGCAERWQVSPKALADEMSRLRRRKDRDRSRELFNESEKLLANYGDRVNREASLFPGSAKAEELVIGILINFPEEYAHIRDDISPESFSTEFNRRVFAALSEALADPAAQFDISMILKDLSPEEAGRVARMAVGGRGETNRRQTLEQLAQRLKSLREKEERPKGRDMEGAQLEEYIKSLRK